MIGHKLAIEQPHPGVPHHRNQPSQRDFGCVIRPTEHAFAAKHLIETDAIESADQLAVLPAFDRMGVAYTMQRGVAVGDPVADPAAAIFACAIISWSGAFFHHIAECCVTRHSEVVPPEGLDQRAGTTKPV
jgi:hypothetical protein